MTKTLEQLNARVDEIDRKFRDAQGWGSWMAEMHRERVALEAEIRMLRGEWMTIASFDLVEHLYRQRTFSEQTFGPGARTKGVIDHIRKELIEIEAAPRDLKEWTDVILLALDGAWRAGHSPEAIAAGILMIQTRNERRTWPDWRTADPDKAIEHDRTGEVRMREALTAARDWFQAYAAGHANKGDTDKATRNQERADFCAAAIKDQP